MTAVLWGAARPPQPSEQAPCARPAERRSEQGWSVWVDCDPDLPLRPLRGAAPLLFGRPLDLNEAPALALEVLPGIGPARAARIERARRLEPFASLADLARIRGIGAGTLHGLEGWAEAGTRVPPGARRESQKCFQLLSHP